MSPIAIQRLLAFVFFALGGWALLFPRVVERLGFTTEHYIGTDASAVLISCFGAQACLCATLIAFSKFRPLTFLVFGLVGSIPFFIFNVYFVFVVEMFSKWMILDFFGNAAILGLCLYGYSTLKAEKETTKSCGQKIIHQ